MDTSFVFSSSMSPFSNQSCVVNVCLTLWGLLSCVGVCFQPLSFLLSLLPSPHPSYPRFSWMCLFLLLCTVGSFSEHLDQINGRSECVDNTDNSSKPSSEPASHMARQRLESTEKKKISGKVTKSLSASALSLMIPGGRETSTRMKLCDLCMCPPFPQGTADWVARLLEAGTNGWCPSTAPSSISLQDVQSSQGACVVHFLSLLSAVGDEASFPQKLISFICFLSCSPS